MYQPDQLVVHISRDVSPRCYPLWGFVVHPLGHDLYLDKRKLLHHRGPRVSPAQLTFIFPPPYFVFQDPLLPHSKQLPHDYSAAALSNFSRCVFVFVFSTQGCNIVYARSSALNDVQRRPPKSRHALALFHCLLYSQWIKSGGTLCI